MKEEGPARTTPEWRATRAPSREKTPPDFQEGPTRITRHNRTPTPTPPTPPPVPLVLAEPLAVVGANPVRADDLMQDLDEGIEVEPQDARERSTRLRKTVHFVVESDSSDDSLSAVDDADFAMGGGSDASSDLSECESTRSLSPQRRQASVTPELYVDGESEAEQQPPPRRSPLAARKSSLPLPRAVPTPSASRGYTTVGPDKPRQKIVKEKDKDEDTSGNGAMIAHHLM